MVALRLIAASLMPMLYALPALASEHEGKKTLAQLDVATYPHVLFWMITSFALFFVLMRLVAVPGVQQTIAKRRHILETDLGAAKLASEEAQNVVKAYEDDLLEARRTAQETVNSIVLAAAHESFQKGEEQEQELKHRMVVAQENLAQAKHEAMSETQKYINALVQEVVAKAMQTGIELPAKAGK